MIHKIALAAIFIQVAITAALAAQVVITDQMAVDRRPSDAVASVPVPAKHPIHRVLILSPAD